MKKSIFLLIAFAFVGIVLLSTSFRPLPSAKPTFADDALIKKGEYLVGIMGCGDCHSPKKMGPHGPEPDMARLLSGYPSSEPVAKIDKLALQSWVLFNMSNTATVGPWGVSFAANLSSDETGIGTWSFEQFKVAMTQGKSKGIVSSRPLLPPMPWPNYINMKDEDLRAVFAYLKSTKPVKNLVPMPITPDKL
jgi:mono/diheme cytochrome c family protein